MSYRLIDNETNEDIIDKLGRIKDERDKYKKVLDKIRKYAEENKIIGVIAREENEYMTHILELLEEINE